MPHAGLSQFLLQWQTILTTFGLRIVVAFVLFTLGRWGAQFLQRTVRQVMLRAHMEASLISFVCNFTYYGAIAFATLAIMGTLGIETTSLVAMLGAASVAVGLALQGSLSNFAAGILLVIFHPFRVGDWIEGASVSGIVEEIQLFTTHIRTFDNRLIIIPNGKLTNDNVTNYSTKGILRVDMAIAVDYSENLQQVKAIVAEVLASDPRILREPAPNIGVAQLGENYIRLAIQPWTKPQHYWDVHFYTYERIVERFRKAEILMPSSKQEVHIHSDGFVATAR
ncbi:MAG TPA: mechanosensitive ion channel domain-containing protein [Stenomitos sp.]